MTYVGPVFAEEELERELCPWCIADGSAADAYDAQFTDVTWRVPDDVSAEVTEVVLRRTPGFSGWQQERWLHHCQDGAEFHGRVGARELHALPDARRALLSEIARYGWSAGELTRCRRRRREPGPTRTVPPSLGSVTRVYPASRALGRSARRAYGDRRHQPTGYSARIVSPPGLGGQLRAQRLPT